jgi:hypothetical protein|tara:strand:- start:373 stop:675 length:303 start_codon:yes stop_codon:yes gene_type:complete
MKNRIYLFRIVTECVTVNFDSDGFDGDEDGAIRDIMAKLGEDYVAALHGVDLEIDDSGWSWTGAIHDEGDDELEHPIFIADEMEDADDLEEEEEEEEENV